jgi:integrase
MAQRINRLSDAKLRAIKPGAKPKRYADGGGLYLLVKPDDRRTWLFRYRDRVTQKVRDKGLGPADDVTLKQAREAAAEARQQLRGGSDPIDSHRTARTAAQLAHAKQKTFGECVEGYIKAHKKAWSNPKHAAQWTSTLDTYAAKLKPLPVQEVDTATVYAVLEGIWGEKTETATRVRQRIESVLDWAAVRGFRSADNPARWKGHLQKLLPSPTKLKGVQNRPALPYGDLPAFMARLGALEGLAPKALALQVLTATRPNEAVAARWSEFDLAKAEWTIPGERMKARKPHRVPLAPRLLAMLKALPRDPSGFLFPGKPHRSITTAATLKVAQTIAPEITAHGFRSTFRDWAAEQTAYAGEVVEAALAHTVKNKTEAAYKRTDHFDKRANLMADWERFAFRPAGKASVTPINKKRGHARA